jgi:hypothetical protein
MIAPDAALCGRRFGRGWRVKAPDVERQQSEALTPAPQGTKVVLFRVRVSLIRARLKVAEQMDKEM